MLYLIIPNYIKAGSPCKLAKALAVPNSNERHAGCVSPIQSYGSFDKQLRDIENKQFPFCGTCSIADWCSLSSLCSCCVQSKDIMGTDSPNPTEDQQENVGFSSDVTGSIVTVPMSMSDYNVDSSTNVELGKFLSRPVLISTITWLENDIVDEFVQPWSSYFNTASIRRKLDNYYLLRCNLHIKVVINASPFYYGCVQMAYRPLNIFGPAPIYSGAGAGDITLMGRSQRPHICVYPQNCQGGEMVLPFLYHQNWLNATDIDALEGMGILNFDSFGILANANSVVGQGVTIQVYAWAEDVQLAGPTIDLALQSKDEYGKGVVSAKASAIARYADILSNIPVMAPFATATSMVASAIGQAASIFGYTNVPVIDPVHAFRMHPLPQFASAHIGTPMEKLTMDPKNELSIDPRIAGVDIGDELMVSSMVQRESYLTQVTWSAVEPTNALLFASAVNPALCLRNPGTNQEFLQLTPMGIPNMMFSNWRGDLVFRIKFICSKYHRGRVKISWDPVGQLTTTAETTSLVYTKIVDITSENDIEFVVPYTQLTSYLKTEEYNARFGSGLVTPSFGVDNGMLTVRVLTQQTSPVASADISLLMYVRGSNNLEFANPRSFAPALSPYAVQSKDVYDVPTLTNVGVKPSVASDSMNLIHMGETVVSLREIMRRDCYVQTSTDVSLDSNEWKLTLFRIPRLPSYRGFDGAGYSTAQSTFNASSKPYNYSLWTPLNWVSQCFVGHRGSIHWSANLYSYTDKTRHDFVAFRQTRSALSSSTFALTISRSTASESFILHNNAVNRDSLFSGGSQTNPKVQPTLTVSAPMYSRFKFLPTSAASRNLGETEFDTDKDAIQFQTNYYTPGTGNAQDRVFIDLFCSIGTDFNLIFFLNVPTLYLYSTPFPTV